MSGVSELWVRRVIQKTLARAGRKASSYSAIGVYLTDNREIRKINKRFLKHDYATDVISFGLGQSHGDIVVSAQMAKETAKELGIAYREELARYVAHGLLHLLGYDDKKKTARVQMHAIQEKIVAGIHA
jgi:probable rRNA maturation factor